MLDFKVQTSSVVHILCKLFRQLALHFFDQREFLFLFDLFVLFFLRFSRQALPRQLAFDEVQHHIAETLEVVSPRLLVAEVRVQRSVARCAGEVLAFFPRDVLACLRISESLRQSEVDHVHECRLLVADHEVVGFDVSMQEVARLAVLDAFETLDAEHDCCLQSELVFAILEQVLETGTEQFHHHDVVIAFDDGSFEFRGAFAFQKFDELSFTHQLIFYSVLLWQL